MNETVATATKTKWPPHCIYYASIDYISRKTRSSSLMKAYLWSTNDANASWTVNGRQWPPQQGTKPASGKVVNFSSYSSCKTFIPRQLNHGCTYCSIIYTNELLVSMCFWVKKELTGGQISSEKHCIRGRSSVFVSSLQPLHHTGDWIESF